MPEFSDRNISLKTIVGIKHENQKIVLEYAVYFKEKSLSLS